MHWLSIVLVVLALGYLGYSLSFTFRRVTARRAGDEDRADDLAAKRAYLRLGYVGLLTLGIFVFVAIALLR